LSDKKLLFESLSFGKSIMNTHISLIFF